MLKAQGDEIDTDLSAPPLSGKTKDVVKIIDAMLTQWNLSYHGMKTGLNYLALEPVSRYIGIEIDSVMFQLIQIAEIIILSNQKSNLPSTDQMS